MAAVVILGVFSVVRKIYEDTIIFNKTSFVELEVSEIRRSKSYPDGVKYRFSFIFKNQRVLAYDNAEGKGHHMHYFGEEDPLSFKGWQKLKKDFIGEVYELRRKLEK